MIASLVSQSNESAAPGSTMHPFSILCPLSNIRGAEACCMPGSLLSSKVIIIFSMPQLGDELVNPVAFMQKRLLASSGFSGVYTQLFLSVLNVNVYKISLRKCAVRSNFDFSVFPHTSSMLVIGFSKDGRIM